MSGFQELLTDIIGITDPFRSYCQYIKMKRKDDGDLMAVIDGRDNAIQITAKAKKEIPEFQTQACLGSLPYLKQVLDSSFMRGTDAKNTKIDLTVGKSSNGASNMLKSIDFTTKRLTVKYNATDPFIGDINKKTRPVIATDWPVTFSITDEMLSNFEDVVRIHTSAPKINPKHADVFTLVYQEDSVSAQFGDTTHQVSAVLADGVTSSATKISTLLPISIVRAMFKIKANQVAFLAEKAVKIEFDTSEAVYSIIAPGKLISTPKSGGTVNA